MRLLKLLKFVSDNFKLIEFQCPILKNCKLNEEIYSLSEDKELRYFRIKREDLYKPKFEYLLLEIERKKLPIFIIFRPLHYKGRIKTIKIFNRKSYFILKGPENILKIYKKIPNLKLVYSFLLNENKFDYEDIFKYFLVEKNQDNFEFNEHIFRLNLKENIKKDFEIDTTINYDKIQIMISAKEELTDEEKQYLKDYKKFLEGKIKNSLEISIKKKKLFSFLLS